MVSDNSGYRNIEEDDMDKYKDLSAPWLNIIVIIISHSG
jgi:hypothetical protein